MENQGSAKANRTRSGLDSGLDVLERLATGPATLTAIARSAGMSKSGVHSLLATLHRRGFVERGGEGEYRLGLKAWELGSAAAPMEIVRHAAPHMERLARDTDEGVILGLLDGFDVVYIHLVASPQPVRVHTSVGDRLRAHCTSTGLALLAALPEEELHALLPASLDKITENTITDRGELLRELQRVRVRGYAVNRGGWQAEVGGAAVAVPGRARIALCVAAPRYRVTRPWLARICPAMLDAAARIATDAGEMPAARRDMTRSLGRRLMLAYGGFGFVFLYLPLFFLVLFSFNDNIIPSLPFRGFTLKWYRELGFDFVMQDALYNSLVIATWTTAISTLLGTLAAFPLVRCTFPFKRSLRLLVILPMIIPHFLMGVALLIFFSFVQLPLSRLTIILGHVVFTLPFAILVISTRLYGFDRTLELAAADLGATPMRSFRHIVLPLLLPGIIGAAMLVFTLSMDEFLITFFVSGQQGTLPMYIWSLLKDGIAPRVNALASVLLAVTFTLLVLGGWLGARRDAR